MRINLRYHSHVRSHAFPLSSSPADPTLRVHIQVSDDWTGWIQQQCLVLEEQRRSQHTPLIVCKREGLAKPPAIDIAALLQPTPTSQVSLDTPLAV